jgi:hypothetical protein
MTVNQPSDISGLVAYPSTPSDLGPIIRRALARLHQQQQFQNLGSWEENDIPGRFIASDVLQRIEAGNLLVADVTHLNFNVIFEVGYAIGCKKRVFLIRNEAMLQDAATVRQVGIFDTLGNVTYTDSASLASRLSQITDLSPLRFDEQVTSTTAPVYLLLPQIKGDAETRLIARVKKARLFYRSFDPEEHGRLAAPDAIQNVAISHGVVVPLLPNHYKEALVHNLRAAFVAGLAQGMGKDLLFLQSGDDPVPIDCRDLVKRFRFPDQIDDYVADLAASVTASFQSVRPVTVSQPATLLARLTLGEPSAENEFQELGQYYLQTDEFHRALRGEVQIVLGRKGAGKTALFFQLRDRLRSDKKEVVLDLKPEGFQLLKFKQQVLDYLEEGTREHTITAFWEYLLLLEVCHKLLQTDKTFHMRDHKLYDPYQRLAATYGSDDYVSEGDFAERMLKLTQRIAEDFAAAEPESGEQRRLSSGEITELLYKHDVASLRTQLIAYLQQKKGLWILFDNIDKGWPPYGISTDDVLSLRCLLDAMEKIERALRRAGIPAKGIVFVRNDVYENLVAGTSDRGKVAYALVDWTDPELLIELLRRRFVSSESNPDLSFQEVWSQICVSHIRGEETAHYMIERCMMRPRSLIELLRFCRSHAVNLRHTSIQVADIEEGEAQYSTKLVNDIGYELKDIFPQTGDVLYELLGAPREMTKAFVTDLLSKVSSDKVITEKVLDLLLWYGVLGFRRDDGEPAFIYSVGYDMKRLKALIDRRPERDLVFIVNPAFWKGLEIGNCVL